MLALVSRSTIATVGLVPIEAIVLCTVNAQPALWEAILPEICLGMPAELEAAGRGMVRRVSLELQRSVSTPGNERPGR